MYNVSHQSSEQVFIQRVMETPVIEVSDDIT